MTRGLPGPQGSALYVGGVTHRRRKPVEHRLRYRIFMLLLDLDELGALAGRHRLLSRNRFNLLSFHDRDHGDGSPAPLRLQTERKLAQAGLDLEGGAIRLLCMPRILGYVFNPLSVYFCHRPGGELAAILYEVSNTFGERHTYLIPAGATGRTGMVRQGCDKAFYVSPFMDMALHYDFDIRPPGEAVSVNIAVSDAQGPVLDANFAGRRQPLSDAALLRAWLGHPLMTLKVMAGIHWEALRIWRKGLKLRLRPPAPTSPVTIVSQPTG